MGNGETFRTGYRDEEEYAETGATISCLGIFP